MDEVISEDYFIVYSRILKNYPSNKPGYMVIFKVLNNFWKTHNQHG